MSAKPTVEVEGAEQVLGAVNPSADVEEIPCADLPLVRRIEALLFAADRPLSDSRTQIYLVFLARANQPRKFGTLLKS